MMKLIFSMLLFFLLSACGFHLRGSAPLPHSLEPLHIEAQNPYSELMQNLKQSLLFSGAKLSTKENVRTILNILSETKSQQLLSQGGTGQTSQYNLNLTVTFNLFDNKGNAIIQNQAVKETRQITLKTNQILAGSNEELNIYFGMRRALTYDIINRITSKEVTTEIEKHKAQ